MSEGQNFCPKYRNHVTSTYTTETRHFLLNLPLSQASAHSRCTIRACRGRVSRADNEPKHCSDCQGCGLVAPPMVDIKNCIEDDSIPLLRFRHTKQGNFDIEVVRANFESRYVAVSHVWTGGLGNPDRNELFQCQLSTIAASGKQIRQIIEGQRYPSIPNQFRRLYRKFKLGDINLFWVDTLCIPVREMNDDVESDTSRRMRGKAIDRMTQIYAGAHSVLVIDPEIRHLDNEMLHTDPDQFYGRFIRSDWMRRCWTYQEGAMAGRLFTLLSSGLVYLTQHRFKILQDNSNEFSERQKELTRWISDLPGPRQTQEYASRSLIIGRDQKTFAEVWRALVSRTTSQEADRYLIFALMLNLVPSPLLGFRSDLDRQSSTIFNSLERIPLDFIYNGDDFRRRFWLPSNMGEQSFSGNYLTRRNFDQPWLTLTAESAMAGTVSPGLYFLEHTDLHGDGILISTATGERVAFLGLKSEHERELRDCHPLVLLVKDTNAFDDTFNTTAVLFQYTPDSAEENVWKLERLCATTCVLAAHRERIRARTSRDDFLSPRSEHVFEIICGKYDEIHIKKLLPAHAILTYTIDFHDDQRLVAHRDPLLSSDAGLEVAIPMYMHRDAHIMVFFSLYLLLTGLIGCIPSAISFSPVWLVLIVWIVCLPMIVDLFETMDRSKRTGNDIMHAHWIDALTPEMPEALPRRVRLLKRINRGPIWTCSQLALGMVFTSLGIVYYDNRDRRVMIVLGIMWILELGCRWSLELAYNYIWRVSDEHPLLREFLQDSRLTTWCKHWLGFPRASESAREGLQDWYNI